MKRPVHGILLLDKPIGQTSNKALQIIKHLFKAKKAGHTGSLDPLATGMLPLCFGEATKFSQFLLDSDKTYVVTAQLGIRTTTGDSEGDVIAEKPVVDMALEKIEQVAKSFEGEIEQIPPMFSAVKVNGRPLYELARKGLEIERKARKIKIYDMQIDAYDADQQSFTFTVRCSKGTYVRTLVEDMGEQLGCGAYVTKLHRKNVHPYGDAMMYTPEMLKAILEKNGMEGLDACLLPVETSVDELPAVKLSTSAAFYMRTGQPVRATFPLDSKLVRLYGDNESFLGIGEVTEDARVKPFRLLSQRATQIAV